MSLAILAMGTAVPETVINQADAGHVARSLCASAPEHASWLSAIYGTSSIQSRRTSLGPAVVRDLIDGTRLSQSEFLPSVQDRGPSTGQRSRHYALHAPPLATSASRIALERSGRRADSVTHLITVSCTGFFSPGIDTTLISELGLPSTVERTHIGFMGCHGALNGLRAARAFAEADPEACVLLCAVELCSVHYHYGWDPQRMIANAIFADGAAAVVGVGEREYSRDWHMAASGSCLIPNSQDAMSWIVGDHGFEMTLSKKVPDLIHEHLRPWLTGWLQTNRLALSDVRSWAIHPGGPHILVAVEKSLGLASSAADISRSVFSEFGNMSSPTVLFILDRLRSIDAPRPCVALGFGPGLVAEAALFR